jgi:PEP-CTERM motif
MRNTTQAKLIMAFSLFLGMALWTSTARADVVSVGPGAFPPGSTLINLTGLADGTEVNGLSVGGVVFTYSLGNGQVVIDGGPGITNNISPPNIVSVGNNTGILTIMLSSSSTMFGYGYAILNTVAVTNATTITLFNGATNVGSLSYNGVVDPTFAGGFAGIQSTLAFDRVQVTFNSALAPAFALDNIRISTVPAIPEPTSMVLLGTGLAFVAAKVRARRKNS